MAHPPGADGRPAPVTLHCVLVYLLFVLWIGGFIQLCIYPRPHHIVDSGSEQIINVLSRCESWFAVSSNDILRAVTSLSGPGFCTPKWYYDKPDTELWSRLKVREGLPCACEVNAHHITCHSDCPGRSGCWDPRVQLLTSRGWTGESTF